MKIGDTVKSHFRARWTGVIIGMEKRGKISPLATVKVLLDRNGNKLRKPITKTLDSAHLTIVEKIDD